MNNLRLRIAQWSCLLLLLVVSIFVVSSCRRTSQEQISDAEARQLQLEMSNLVGEHDDPSQELLYFVNKRLPSESDETKPHGNDEPGNQANAATASLLENATETADEVYNRVLPGERYVIAAKHSAAMSEYATATASLRGSLQQSYGLVATTNISNLMAGNVQEATVADTSGERSTLDTWKPLGPGNVAGRTRSLLIDPRNPKIMYAASVGGGVWKSENGGESWGAISDFIANISTSSLAMDPQQPDTLYAGTGEGYFNFDAQRGAGIFKLMGDKKWQVLSSTAQNSDFWYVQKIIVSPKNSAVIYAATNRGLLRSTNGGKTFQIGIDANPVHGCMDIAIWKRPDSNAVSKQPEHNYLFVSCGTFAQGTVYRAEDTDGSQSWDSVLQLPHMGRTSLAISSSSPNVIYAVAATTEQGQRNEGLLGVYRSSSHGDPGSWTTEVDNTNSEKRYTVLLTNPRDAFFQECKTNPKDNFLNQGWYDNVIAVDPMNSDIVWVGGTDLFRSDDAGKTWSVASYWWKNSTADPKYAHADQHAITFPPNYDGKTNANMYVANDGGIFKTADARAALEDSLRAICGVPSHTVIKWEAKNRGFAVAQFYNGAFYPDGKRFFGGTQDNGTIMGSETAGVDNWSTIQGGDGGFVAIDATSTTLYASFTGNQITKSSDGGKHFELANAGLQGRFLFITPFVMDPKNHSRLWTGGNRLYRTDDAGKSWKPASTQLDAINYSTPSGTLNAIAVSPTDPNVVVAGFAESGIVGKPGYSAGGWIHYTDKALSADASTKWDRSRPRTGWVSSITISPSEPKTVFATYSSFDEGTNKGHVWKSLNGGQAWKNLDGSGRTSLPDIPVHTLVLDPRNLEHIYVGTDLGIYVSLDGGATWSVENSGFPNVIVQFLTIGEFSGTEKLFAFTHGRGAWEVELK
jgi:hypothetical protein